MGKRVVGVKVLPGEPTDGSGRVCIHLFVQDERGPFVEPHVLHQAVDEQRKPIKQKLVARPTRGRLACSTTRQVAPVTRNGVVQVTSRTSDPRAATCLRCKDSTAYKEMMSLLEVR